MPLAREHVVDLKAALSRVERDLELLREIIQVFQQEHPKMLAAIREGLSRGDAAAIEVTAHSLKGALGTVGAVAAAEVALMLESLGREGDLARAEEAYAELEEEIQRLSSAFAAYRVEDGAV